MKEKRQSERRAKEDFIYIIPESQKSVQPQSCHGNVCYKAKKQFVKDSRMDNSYIAGKILVWLELLIFCFFLYPMTLKKTGFVPVDGWLLLAKIWENEDGGDMVVWAQTGCSAPSEESPALWIGSWCTGEICIHLVIPAGGTDYYLTLILQRPVQRKWDLDIFFPLHLFQSYCSRRLSWWGPHSGSNIFLCLFHYVGSDKYTDCFCSTVLSLHPFQHRMADWTKP